MYIAHKKVLYNLYLGVEPTDGAPASESTIEVVDEIKQWSPFPAVKNNSTFWLCHIIVNAFLLPITIESELLNELQQNTNATQANALKQELHIWP